VSRQQWWMVIVTHESYDSVLVGIGKQEGLELPSENREWRRRCDVERQVVRNGAPETGNDCLLAVERWTGRTSRRCVMAHSCAKCLTMMCLFCDPQHDPMAPTASLDLCVGTCFLHRSMILHLGQFHNGLQTLLLHHACGQDLIAFLWVVRH